MIPLLLIVIFLGMVVSPQSQQTATGEVTFLFKTSGNGFTLDSAEPLPQQFRNNLTGMSGRWCDGENFIPGDSAWADQLAQRSGLQLITLNRYRIEVMYQPGFLSEETEAGELTALHNALQKLLGKRVFLREKTKIDNNFDCDAWAGNPKVKCVGDYLYLSSLCIPKFDLISQTPGVQSLQLVQAKWDGMSYIYCLEKGSRFSWGGRLQAELAPLF